MAGDWQALAAHIRAEMARRGWRQRDLAAAASVSPRTITRVVNGKLRELPYTIAAVELAVGWEPGTARRIVEEGAAPPGSPTTTEDGPSLELIRALVLLIRLADTEEEAVRKVHAHFTIQRRPDESNNSDNSVAS